ALFFVRVSLDVEGGGVGAALDVELVEDVDQVVFDGVVAELQGGADFLVGLAFGDEGEHAAFLRGEGGELFVLLGAAVADHAHDAGHDVGGEDGFAGGDVLHGLDEALGVDFLHQVALGAGGDGVVDEVVVDEGGEDEDAGVGAFFENLAAGGEAGAVGQADVEQDDVGLESGGGGDGVGDVGGFADDLDRGGGVLGLEDGFDALADKGAVVHEKNADGVGAAGGGGGGHGSGFVKAKGGVDASPVSGGGADVEVCAEQADAFGDVVETATASHGVGGETGSVVGDGQAGVAVVAGEGDFDESGPAVAHGVADGFADDLQRLGAHGQGELVGETFVDVDAGLDLLGGGVEGGDEAVDGVGKGAALQGLGFEAGDEVAHVADGVVEHGADFLDAGGGFGGAGLQLALRGGEAHAGGVDGLDDAVVQIAAEPGAFVERALQGGFGGGALGDFLPQEFALLEGGFHQAGDAGEFGVLAAEVADGGGV